MGVTLAIVFRRWDVTPLKRYTWEDDDSIPEWFPQREAPLHDSSREVPSAEVTSAELPSGNTDAKKPSE